MKAMSIIGVIFFPLALFIMLMLLGSDEENAAVGWGVISLLYAIPYSITGLIVASKNINDVSNLNKIKNITAELMQLSELKDKGVLTEEEFQSKKRMLI